MYFSHAPHIHIILLGYIIYFLETCPWGEIYAGVNVSTYVEDEVLKYFLASCIFVALHLSYAPQPCSALSSDFL